MGLTFPSCKNESNVDKLDGATLLDMGKDRNKLHEQLSGKLVVSAPSLMLANNSSVKLMC